MRGSVGRPLTEPLLRSRLLARDNGGQQSQQERRFRALSSRVQHNVSTRKASSRHRLRQPHRVVGSARPRRVRHRLDDDGHPRIHRRDVAGPGIESPAERVVPDGRQEVGGVRDRREVVALLEDFRFHDLRHTFASHMMMRGASIGDLKDIRGGREAYRAGRPPLVVTDLKTPGMTGIELLRQARAVDGDVAVIVLTGGADVKNAIESLKLGAHAFLMKPINIDELLITVERALERRQLLIERRQHHEPYGQPQETDRTMLGRADLAQQDVPILVVEEDRQVREVLRQIFELAGYKCLLTGDGKEGLKAFRESRPSLVIADLGMPMMVRVGKWVHGVWVRDARIGLLMEIWLEDPDAAGIVCTSGVDAQSVIELLKLRAHASLMKPINIDELLITAERALERPQLLVENRRHHV